MRHGYSFVKPRDECNRTHSAIEPCDETTAVERGHGPDKCEYWKRQDQCNYTGQDQHFNGIETHGRQRVNFLTHFHRAKFGGVGTPGPAGDHDGNDQDANFAEYEYADQVDYIGFCAELAEMKDSLLGDDRADQKCDHGDDRDRLPANLMQVINEGF